MMMHGILYIVSCALLLTHIRERDHSDYIIQRTSGLPACHQKAHPAVKCVEDHWDADEMVRWVVCQILPELTDICVHLRGR